MMGLDSMDYWRLCDELSVLQAALLVVGEDPASEVAHCEAWSVQDRPTGYEAAKNAIVSALKRGAIAGLVIEVERVDPYALVYGVGQGGVDIKKSVLEVSSLREWLAARGFRSGFFFPSNLAPDYANPHSQFYAPELAAAVGAWQAVSSDASLVRGRKPKQAVIAWLRKNGEKYGLLDDEGNPREKRIGEIATFANWDKSPGAARTPDSPLDAASSTPYPK